MLLCMCSPRIRPGPHAMSPFTAMGVFCGLFLPLSLSEYNTLNCIPRKSVLYQNNMKLFREEGIWNYSTMLVREDLGLLLLGAREVVYALNISDISIKKAVVYWQVTDEKQKDCKYKGKHAEIECRNYIRTLHKVDHSRMYVCGTNAFSPICDYMTYSEGKLTLENTLEEGKGKCPFDPFQRYSSIMVGNDLYSATSINFLGSEPVVLRSSNSSLRTEFKSSWLNEPNFVYMDLVPESMNNPEGDDDKVYLFFSENAVEYDFYNKLVVSRVARVCKKDMGGQRTLQRKWTSFLKARLDCSLPEPSLPSVVQDVFLVKDSDWGKSVFYAVFTPQSSSSDVSTVCAYNISAIGHLFDTGKFKTPVTVETSHVKWVMYSGEVPTPRPGACINNAARSHGMMSSLDLPDKTLQFIRDRPLMDDAVPPLTGRPLLVKKGAKFTRLVVDNVLALDGERYAVLFIGTENGYVQKAVNYAGEMFIIEEIQLYQTPDSIKTMRLSSSTGQLYTGSDYGAVQMPLSDCGRYELCLDCVLARDPYCGWDLSAGLCSDVSNSKYASEITSYFSGKIIQSLKEGDISKCPKSETVKPENYTLFPGNNIKLPCQPDSNLAVVHWIFSGQPLPSDTKHYIYNEGLLILNASADDAGQYTCESEEQVNSRTITRTMAIYRLQPNTHTGGSETTTEPPYGHSTAGPEVTEETDPLDPPLPPASRSEDHRVVGLQVAVAILSLMLVGLVAWNLYKGQFRKRSSATSGAGQLKNPSINYTHIQNSRTSEIKPLRTAPIHNANNNHCAIITLKGNGEQNFSSGGNTMNVDGLGYIHDESEI
ncbi:semaphorin-4E isoform X1 [Esox lucius]|uniref:semaphorin-4E isoform X1 n=1 Tax=Esox lucius TaxID=8010 RepID=UPI0005760DA7|nr:semaphorin-4E isoform X1 [Esox lucius]XP_028977641.1 semaphorin-4E isoform X1 [Esox lucius]XP_028977642.1 semaphorin-4E isoform X1 [Esox lucius]XP_028977643.1 semaphorin-4E isoform X1 [Esox lucius]